MKYQDLGLVNTREMFRHAYDNKYAVPAYNFNNLEQLQAIILACAETGSPVILQVSRGARKYMGSTLLKHLAMGATEYAREMGGRFPIALHLDHGNSFESCVDAIDSGFSSVMIDGSDLPFDENIALTKRVVEYAKKFDVSVEGELGILGGIEEDIESDKSMYTNPDDVVKFVELTGVDSLAISIGTSHGAYKFKNENAKLRLDILDEIAKKLPNFPLVLHGASSVPEYLIDEINKFGGRLINAHGVPESELRLAVQKNICKINVDSDSRLAFTAGIRKVLSEQPDVFDPRTYLSVARDKMVELYKNKNVDVMSSNNRYK